MFVAMVKDVCHNNLLQIWVTVDYVVIMESYHGDSSYMYTTHEVILRVYRYSMCNTKWVYCLELVQFYTSLVDKR